MPWTERPERCVLVNLTSFEQMKCQFNPTTLQRSITVNWNRLVVPGLSHEPMQYSHTGNESLGTVEFRFDQVADRGYDVRGFEGFVRALTVPPEPLDGITQAYPPRCLFVWPGTLSFETVLTRAQFRYELFFRSGAVRSMISACGFEAIYDFRQWSQDRRIEVPLKSTEIEDVLIFSFGFEG